MFEEVLTTPLQNAVVISSLLKTDWDELEKRAGNTAKNTVISSDFLVWKICEKTQFPNRKSGEIGKQEIRWNYGIFRSETNREKQNETWIKEFITGENSIKFNPAFLYTLKTSENLKVFSCFQGV